MITRRELIGGACIGAAAAAWALALACAWPAGAQTRISQMPPAASLSGTELLPVLQSGANAVTTPLAIASFVNSSLCGTNSSATLASITGTALHYGAGLYASAGADLVESATAPTIASGCGTGAAVSASTSGTAAFAVTIGSSPGTTCVIAMPPAGVQNGWRCSADDLTTTSEAVHQTAASTSSCTLTFDALTTGAATAPAAGDVIVVSAAAY
jgi:hypothetical protein